MFKYIKLVTVYIMYGLIIAFTIALISKSIITVCDKAFTVSSVKEQAPLQQFENRNKKKEITSRYKFDDV